MMKWNSNSPPPPGLIYSPSGNLWLFVYFSGYLNKLNWYFFFPGYLNKLHWSCLQDSKCLNEKKEWGEWKKNGWKRNSFPCLKVLFYNLRDLDKRGKFPIFPSQSRDEFYLIFPPWLVNSWSVYYMCSFFSRLIISYDRCCKIWVLSFFLFFLWILEKDGSERKSPKLFLCI